VATPRGFIIKYLEKVRQHPGIRLRKFLPRRLIVTAAHCLPEFPPAHAASHTYERTFKLLGSLDGSKTGILAECLFVNPVADIAVLGCPDNQVFEEATAYEELTEDAPFLRIDKARSGKGWVLSLDGHWTRPTIETAGRSLSLDGMNEAGMSGSPILNDAGRAVGIVVVGTVKVDSGEQRGRGPAAGRAGRRLHRLQGALRPQVHRASAGRHHGL
jgi:hypothetical protein